MYLVYDKFTKKELNRYNSYREIDNLLPLPYRYAYRQVSTWTTVDGRAIPTCDMADAHLMNVIKYSFSVNKMPTFAIFEELQFRGKLSDLADKIVPSDGYVSPTEMATQRYGQSPVETVSNMVHELAAVIERYLGQEKR